MNHLPILIDSGASRSARGRKWAGKWFRAQKLERRPIDKLFRFGAGPSMKSLGTVKTFIQANQKFTNVDYPVILPIRVDVADSEVPMLISHESLCRMKGIIDFESCTLEIPNIGKIESIKTHSGHLVIQGGATLPGGG